MPPYDRPVLGAPGGKVFPAGEDRFHRRVAVLAVHRERRRRIQRRRKPDPVVVWPGADPAEIRNIHHGLAVWQNEVLRLTDKDRACLLYTSDAADDLLC